MITLLKESSVFYCKRVAFSSNIGVYQKKIKLLNKPNDLVKFDYANDDHRNYDVGSKNFRKFFKILNLRHCCMI